MEGRVEDVRWMLAFALLVAASFLSVSEIMRSFKIGYNFITRKQKKHQEYYVRDYTCSIIYTAVVSTWAAIIYMSESSVRTDPVTAYSKSALYLAAFTYGRFIFHLHAYLNEFGFCKDVVVKVVHHLIILGSGFLIIGRQLYMGFVVLFHFNEIPVCLLCIRGWLILAGSGGTKLFTVNKWLLIITWFVFRLATMVMFGAMLVADHHLMPLIHLIVIAGVWLYILPYNFNVFYKLFRNDFLISREKES